MSQRAVAYLQNYQSPGNTGDRDFPSPVRALQSQPVLAGSVKSVSPEQPEQIVLLHLWLVI